MERSDSTPHAEPYPLMLVGARAHDRLLDALATRAQGLGLPFVSFEEAELFGGCAFALERRARQTRGFLTHAGRRVQLEELGGVVLRLPRQWWPGQGFDLQDQMFVYHETAASWYALLDALACPVLNRFGLGWWLHDACYALDLASGLRAVLDLERDAVGGPGAVESVYRAGGVSIAAPGCSEETCARLAGHAASLAWWERDSGVSLARLDFERHGDSLRLARVDPFPLLEHEPAELVARVAGAALDGIQAERRMTA